MTDSNMIQMGWTIWGIKPWWNAVKWWWPQDRRKSISVLICSAVPAIFFSIRYGGWEASKADYIETSDQ